jgi:ribosomal protein S18 acetylase RimI-like enzyme
MKIRKFKVADIPELVKLVKGEPTVEDYPGEYSQKVFAQMLKDEETMVLVVEEKNKPIAFQEFKLDNAQKRIYLETVVVSKECRGRGIASMLMRELEKFAKSKKYRRIAFVVRKWNKPMNSLAMKAGYKSKDELVFWEKQV